MRQSEQTDFLLDQTPSVDPAPDFQFDQSMPAAFDD
jgi:hypothetical protein